MEVNRTFKSYNDFEAYRAEYERDTKQVFIKGPSSKKFGIGEDERDTIVYKAVTFNCVHGKDRASESTGNRPFQHTKKTGCPVTFKVNGYKKTGTLSVRIAPDILQHTHPLTEASWQHETQKRKLTTDEEHTVKDLLTMNVPVAQITKVMVAETGKPIRPKDIHNLRGRS